MGEPLFAAGRVLLERYRLETLLGEGGFGSIWRADHLILHAPVAVKLIAPEVASQPGVVERFLREARAAAALRSPHVVQVLDYGVEEGRPFMVMELLEGENLADRLQRVGRLAPSDVVKVVTHVARAIARAHELSIVHRDLKPENVFLVSNEDDEVAKVLDFGVAKFSQSGSLLEGTHTRTGSLIGTPYYMSPEQVQGNKTVDHRSDLWALGVIAFEMFTGRRPFQSEALGDLVLQICIREIPRPSDFAPVPSGFDAWFERAVARDPDARFQTARELANQLREVAGAEGRATIYTGFEESEQASRPGDGRLDTPTRQETPRASDTLLDARSERPDARSSSGEPSRLPLMPDARGSSPLASRLGELATAPTLFEPPPLTAPVQSSPATRIVGKFGSTGSPRLWLVAGVSLVLGSLGAWALLRPTAAPRSAGAARVELRREAAHPRPLLPQSPSPDGFAANPSSRHGVVTPASSSSGVAAKNTAGNATARAPASASMPTQPIPPTSPNPATSTAFPVAPLPVAPQPAPPPPAAIPTESVGPQPAEDSTP